MNVYPIILAAGASRRFGSPKQRLPWGGDTLLGHAVLQARAVGRAPATVVLGAEAESIRAVLPDEGLRIVVNHRWREGMASSVRAGIGALSEDAAAALFLLCDQPGVTANTLSALVDRWRRAPASIVTARYNRINGVPAVFPRELFGALLNLTGDRGAKQLFTAYAHRLVPVPAPEAAADIDTPDDLRVFSAEHEVTGV